MSQTLNNSPITEAVVEYKVELPIGMDLIQLQSLHQSILTRYPISKTLHQWSGIINVGNGQNTHQASPGKALGFQFWSQDEKQVSQFRLDSFVYNRIRPYRGWTDFKTEADSLWAIYRAGAKPTAVRRISVRNINSIEIPGTSIELNEYFTASPQSPPGLPQLLAEYMSRVKILYQNENIFAALTISSTPGKVESVTVFLDVDVSKDTVLHPDDPSVSMITDRLREIKNEVFFKGITVKLAELLNK